MESYVKISVDRYEEMRSTERWYHALLDRDAIVVVNWKDQLHMFWSSEAAIEFLKDKCEGIGSTEQDNSEAGE